MDPIPNDIRLTGPLKPMRFEVDIEDCIVQGEIPRTLNRSASERPAVSHAGTPWSIPK